MTATHDTARTEFIEACHDIVRGQGRARAISAADVRVLLDLRRAPARAV